MHLEMHLGGRDGRNDRLEINNVYTPWPSPPRNFSFPLKYTKIVEAS